MTGWEITAPILLGILLIGVLVFSIVRPSSRVRFGIFIERQILEKDEELDIPEPPRDPSEEQTAEWKWPVQKK